MASLCQGDAFARIGSYTILCTDPLPEAGGVAVELLRIGEKLISPERIRSRIEQMLALRVQGLSQQEVAERLGVDRTFVSRLEALGEVRKGGRLALIGFPIANRTELEAVAQRCGVEFVLLMNNEERWRYVQERSGAEVVNEIMNLISKARGYDMVVFLGSDMRIRMAEAMLGSEAVIGVQIGRSPITEDCYVDPARLEALLTQLTSGPEPEARAAGR